MTNDDVEEPSEDLDRVPSRAADLHLFDKQPDVRRSYSVNLTDGAEYVKKLRAIDVKQHAEQIEDVIDNLVEEKVSDSDLFDAACDPNKPRKVHYEDVSSAAYRIRGGIIRTQCTKASQLSRMLGMNIYFKKEFQQVTGSFKERGARYALMKLLHEYPEKAKVGVIAASAGNHALALAYHGKDLGVPVTVVMPVVAPLMKITLCRSYGANIIIEGPTIAESKASALRMAKKQGFTYINGYDHVDILAGQGTIGLEILDDLNGKVDAIIVPVGGGGLIAGIAVAVKHLQPECLIIGVEGENCASFKYAMDNGRVVKAPIKSTIADGLSVATVGVNSFESCHHLIDKMIAVSECYISLAILRLVEAEKSVIEGAGATGLAALLQHELPELKGKRVVLPLTGGNIDTSVLGRCIDRGLAVDGRLARFDIVVSDRPGGIAELAAIIAQCGASIKDMYHERAWLMTDIFSVRVKVVVETRDRDHLNELEQILSGHYKECDFHTNNLLLKMGHL